MVQDNAHGTLHYAHIVGWGMAVPERVLNNDDLAGFVDTSDEWIRTRTGIRERRIAGEGESTATLGLRAAQAALDVADMLPQDIDLIVVATSTPDYAFPATASLIQDWIGATRAGAFDLSAACSGFVYALEMATQAIRAGSIQTALIIGAETMTRVLNWSDRDTCVLFGDGAGAVILRASELPGGVLSCALGSDGSGADLLSIPAGGSRYPASPETVSNGMHKLHMDGRAIFRFATGIVGTSVTEALEKAGLSLDDVSLIVPHQANQRIIEAAARHLKIPPERFFSDLERYGNTSAASIPIALCDAVAQGRIRPNDTVVLVGFGGGLTWGAIVLRWPQEMPPEVGEWARRRRRLVYILALLRSRVMRLWRRIQSFLLGSPMPEPETLSRQRRRWPWQRQQQDESAEAPTGQDTPQQESEKTG